MIIQYVAFNIVVICYVMVFDSQSDIIDFKSF